ncbi:TetR/AcrR family transcriptional regulator [Massilia sp. B-10]|nr:TetR/AcrR family transcriptional regulator [Massilia sp. B-10]
MTTPDAKTRLIAAMVDAMQRQGYHGSGLTELLAAAKAPKGVLYHHFPGGKTELAVAAVDATVERLCLLLDERMSSGDPAVAVMAWINGAQKRLAGSGYEKAAPWPPSLSRRRPPMSRSAPPWALFRACGCAWRKACSRPATRKRAPAPWPP